MRKGRSGKDRQGAFFNMLINQSPLSKLGEDMLPKTVCKREKRTEGLATRQKSTTS